MLACLSQDVRRKKERITFFCFERFCSSANRRDKGEAGSPRSEDLGPSSGVPKRLIPSNNVGVGAPEELKICFFIKVIKGQTRLPGEKGFFMACYVQRKYARLCHLVQASQLRPITWLSDSPVCSRLVETGGNSVMPNTRRPRSSAREIVTCKLPIFIHIR